MYRVSRSNTLWRSRYNSARFCDMQFSPLAFLKVQIRKNEFFFPDISTRFGVFLTSVILNSRYRVSIQRIVWIIYINVVTFNVSTWWYCIEMVSAWMLTNTKYNFAYMVQNLKCHHSFLSMSFKHIREIELIQIFNLFTIWINLLVLVAQIEDHTLSKF